MRCSPMLKQKDSLPGPELHPRIDDRYHLARSRQNHPDMRRHVVGSFSVVLEVRRIFGHEPVEEFFEIAARGWIRVLHDDEAATGMLHENGRGASAYAAAGHDLKNLICDFAGPFPGSADNDRLGIDTQGSHWTKTLRPTNRDAIQGDPKKSIKERRFTNRR